MKLATSELTSPRATLLILIALLVAGFLIWTYGALRLAVSPSWQDTEGFLAHSLYIAEHGGFLGFLRECFTGVFPITERHPLYMLLLEPFAARDAGFFWAAKMINLVTGVIALLTLVWMVMKRYGHGPALIAGLLYGVSNSLVVASSHVNQETLFALTAMWTWWFLTAPDPHSLLAAPERSDQPIEGMPSSRSRWVLAGIWLGLAYLVKSPAALLGVATAMACLIYSRKAFIADSRLWILIVVTALVSSPLLVRNVVGFGTLIYEGVNSSIMWIDEWEEMGDKASISYYDNYGVMHIERNNYPGAIDYFRTHSVAQIGERLFTGLRAEVTDILPRAIGPIPQLSYALGVPWGFIVLGFAAGGIWLRRKSWDAVLVTTWSGAFLVFFGWNHTFDDIRFFAPLVPLWIAFAAYVLWETGLKLLEVRRSWQTLAAVVLITIAWVSGRTITQGALSRPMPIMETTASQLGLIDWFNTYIEPGDRVLIGPTNEFHGLIWRVHRPISVIRTPDVNSLEGFQRYLADRKVRYIVMHAESIAGVEGQLRDALRPHLTVKPNGTIIQKSALPGWRKVYQDEETPRRFIIYEAENASASPVTIESPFNAHS